MSPTVVGQHVKSLEHIQQSYMHLILFLTTSFDDGESDNGDVEEVLNPLLDSDSDDDETVDNVVILGVPIRWARPVLLHYLLFHHHHYRYPKVD